jgi:hypothetical protein
VTARLDEPLSIFLSESQPISGGPDDSVLSEAATIDLARHVTESAVIDQKIIDAERMAAVLTGLEERFNASLEQQNRAMTVNQQLVQQMLDEAQRAAVAVSALENRIVDLSQRHQQLEGVERRIGELEQRAASAFTDVNQAARARDALQFDVSELRDQLHRLTGAFERRPSNSRWVLSPGLPVAGCVALVLSLVIATAVASVWRLHAPPLLASRALTSTPFVTLTALPAAPIAGSDESLSDNPAPPAEPPAPVAQTVAPRTLSKTSTNSKAESHDPPVRAGGARAQFVGTLIVDSDPAGARVYVNQQPVGDTPIVLTGLPIGSYVVRVEGEGYERWSTGVTVSAVREARVTARLDRTGSR